jgi:enolase
MRIKSVVARQIINSKGHPALEVEVSTSKNSASSASPIAASKSKYEFTDAYDNNISRFDGETLENIVENINRIIAPELIGRNCMEQEDLDTILLQLDNSFDRTHLGVNTLTATSQAIAKLGALESDLPLFKYIRVLHDFSDRSNHKLHSEYLMPKPVITVYKASSHNLHNKLPVQEIMLVPTKDFSYSASLIELFQSISHLDLSDSDHSLKTYLNEFHKQIAKNKVPVDIGLDMAASRFKRHERNEYVMPHLKRDGDTFSGDFKKLVDFYLELVEKNKVLFCEDFFDEDDYSAWKELKDGAVKKSRNVQIVSDDFTATNIERLEKVGLLECVNNVVVKPSQIGTVSEVIHFASRARKYGLNLTISYRHGDTEDTFISDLAVGIGAEYLRSGFYLGSEHNSKLNRLLQIEQGL